MGSAHVTCMMTAGATSWVVAWAWAWPATCGDLGQTQPTCMTEEIVGLVTLAATRWTSEETCAAAVASPVQDTMAAGTDGQAVAAWAWGCWTRIRLQM